jgi:hypothetical protein
VWLGTRLREDRYEDLSFGPDAPQQGISVGLGFLSVLNDELFHRCFCRLQLQPELVLNGGENR